MKTQARVRLRAAVALLITVLTGMSATAAQQSGSAGVKPAPAEKRAPAAVRRALPRGAQTLFYVRTALGGATVFVHGWNPKKGNTVVDALTLTPGPRRLQRVSVPRMDPTSDVLVRAALLDAKSPRGGVVLALNWNESEARGAFLRVPMLALVGPAGWSGPFYTQSLETESSASGNEYFTPQRGANGVIEMLHVSESFDAGTQTETRHPWNSRTHQFEPAGKGVEKPLARRDE